MEKNPKYYWHTHWKTIKLYIKRSYTPIYIKHLHNLVKYQYQ